MTNIQKTLVVVGIDGSQCSRRAAEWGADYACATGATLSLVAAYGLLISYGYPVSLPDGYEPAAAAQQSLDDLLPDLDLPAERMRTSVVAGDAAKVLLAAAQHAQLLVVGSRGIGAVQGLLGGSVSSYVLHHATCPVLVIPQNWPVHRVTDRPTSSRTDEAHQVSVRQLIIGNDVFSTDGICGDLARVVVDPVARTLTHLVVEPRHQPHKGRLVPIDLVDAAQAGISLRCTTAAFDSLESAEETDFVPGQTGAWDYPPEQVLAWPYYGLGMGNMYGAGLAGSGVVDLGMGVGPRSVTYEHVPLGEVQIHRGDHVEAKDGAIGRVKGLVIEPSDHGVTHLLLEEGHLWGQRLVAIPVGAVASMGEAVQLNLTKDEVRDLPPIAVDSD